MKLRYVLGALLAALVLVPAALGAGGAAGQGYGGEGGNVQEEVSQGAAPSAAVHSGSLPFTGLDLALLVVGGVTLVVAGVGVRRAARRPSA
jgi:hypothetical protein